MKKLTNKIAVVTGGAQGIGLGISKRLSEEGANVIFLDNNKNLIKNINNSKGQTEGIVNAKFCDLSNVQQTRSVLEETWKEYSKVDIVVNNAGIATRESFLEISEDDWDKIINVNLKAIFIVGQYLAKKMIDNNIAGKIINMGSKNGLSAGKKLAHYNSSKGGVNLLTQTMASELAKYQIQVNSIAPGFIDTNLDKKLKDNDENLCLTERTPMDRLGTIREVANTALFLSSDESSYITGTTIVVDGGHLANSSDL